MIKRQTLFLLLLAFTAGIIFSGIGYLVFSKSKPFFAKVRYKLNEMRIANIRPAKEIVVLSDFENPEDLQRWDVSGAKIELSSEHATSGNYAARLTYYPAAEEASVRIERYSQKNKKLSNWSGHEVVSLDLFNPQKTGERMILQIKDSQDRKIKIEFMLPPNENRHIEVDIRQLWDSLNPAAITQFNLFLWGSGTQKVFYLDNLKVIPAAALAKLNKHIASEEFLPKDGEQLYATGDYFAFKQADWFKIDKEHVKGFVEVPLLLPRVPAAGSTPVPLCAGVPFPKGELRSGEYIEVVDAQGAPVAFQSKPLGWWPNKSIKWLLVTLNTPLLAEGRAYLFLRYNQLSKPAPAATQLKIAEDNRQISVETGPLKFTVPKNGFYLFGQVWQDGNANGIFEDEEKICHNVDLTLSHNRTEYFSHLDQNPQVVVEETGPVRSCIRASGWFVSPKGQRFCKFIVRIYAFSGSRQLKVQHTFIYTGYPQNQYHYLYKGKRLPKNETIESVSIVTPLNLGGEQQYTFADSSEILQSTLQTPVQIFQHSYNQYEIMQNNRQLRLGSQLKGWLDVSSASAGVAIGIQNCWQQFPKAFVLEPQAKIVRTYLWPPQAGELDLKTTAAAYGPDEVARGSAFGLAKTHTLAFYFHPQPYQQSATKQVMEGMLTDVLLCPTAEWVSATRVLGRVAAYDQRLLPPEEFLSRLFDWGGRQIENFHWYGMVDFGDTLSWYRKDSFDKSYEAWGWHPEGRWGWFNCEVMGTHTGALIQFLRTTEQKYFLFGANLSRHLMDIDTCHYNTVAQDKRLTGVIPDDYSQPGSMHRHNGNHWGGRNEETSHTNLNGLLLYYYLTGDERAREVLDEIGSFFLSGRVTYFRHPDIAPQRSLANILWGLVDLYELTGDAKYKNAADKWAEIFYRGQKYDGAWAENYNPVFRRWEGKPSLMFMNGYTLPGLIAYHQLTGNKAIAASIIKATEYNIQNEPWAPYFISSAYSYWLTGEQKYLDNVKARVDFTLGHQNQSADPLTNGMIYQKAYYMRVMEYLYQLPFALEVLGHAD